MYKSNQNDPLWIYKQQQTPFHLVTPSPWPLVCSWTLFLFILEGMLYWNGLSEASKLTVNLHAILLISYFSLLVFFIFCWFNDIIIESTFEGYHTLAVQKGLRMGITLFIISEVMFFFSFFWSFFYYSLHPSVGIGCTWPPQSIEVISPWGMPFYNTVLLLSSGVTLVIAHRGFVQKSRKDILEGLILTVLLGSIFLFCQGLEYIGSNFSINDTVYGSIFFLMTGFHGLHVLIGTIVLLVTLLRHINYHFSREHHIGFEAAAWYWHFVVLKN